MCKKGKTVERHFYNNTFIKYFNIIAFLVIVILFVWQWICLQESFNSFKKETQKQITSLENVKTNLISLEEVEKDSLNYLFKEKDIEKINNNLNALASEIYQERNKAEAIIDKDIDRLNLYMSIGIGFLAILGVFVPISINLLSNDDLKKKQERLDSKSSEIHEKTLKLEEEVKVIDSDELKQAISNAKQAIEKSKEIEELKTKTDVILPKLSLISLQIAIHRLFNQSSLALTNSRKNSSALFVKLFTDVKTNLEKCKNDSLLIIETNSNLKQTIQDLAILLKDQSFKYTSYVYSREIEVKAKKTIISLEKLSCSTKNDQDATFIQVLETLDVLINEIKNTDA